VLDGRRPGGSGGRARALTSVRPRFLAALCLLSLALVPRSISRCPKCREPVSQFAAGCAVCGTDLQAARAELTERRAKRPHLPGGVPRLGDDAIRIAVTVLAALFSPLMGALLAAYFAYDADRDGRLRTAT
jgi:hypothetical protein